MQYLDVTQQVLNNRGGNHLPQSTGYAHGDAVQDAVGPLRCHGVAACQHPQGHSRRAAPQAPLSSACIPARGSSFPGARLGICPR